MSRAGKIVRRKVNRLIDRLIHPYFKDYPALIPLDGLLHAAAEQDPNVSLGKFVRYNAPKILRYLARKQKQSNRMERYRNSTNEES